MPDETPVLSAIVVDYRNEDTVLRAVASLVDQDFDQPYEIIVATSGGGRSSELLRQHYPDVRVIESPVQLMPGAARNMGTEVAKGGIIAFLEGNCVARPDWIRNRVDSHRAGHDAVAGSIAVTKPVNLAARATALLRYNNRFESSLEGPAGLTRSYALSLTQELLSKVGPFDEALPTDEDVLMARRLSNLGIDPWFDPSVCVEQVGQSRLGHFLREQGALGRRQARSELVSCASGSLRIRLEARSAVLAVLLRAAWRGLGRSEVLFRNMKSLGTNFSDVLLTLPWILLGFCANLWNWGQEEYAYARTGTFTELDEAGPTSAPLRRQTATTGERTLVLTFDDGPSGFTSEVLRVLAKYRVPATFFLLGERVEDMPHVVRAIARAGHTLAIHGWGHTAFTELEPGELASEVGRTQGLVRELTGANCYDVRPPFGLYNRDVISWLAGQGCVTWLWTADARDHEPEATVDQIVERTLLGLTPGGIVLMHDGGGDRSNTVRALPRIIRGARDRGFRFVALEEVRAGLRPSP